MGAGLEKQVVKIIMPNDSKFTEFFSLPPFDSYLSQKEKDLLLHTLQTYLKFIPIDKLETFMPYDLTETSTLYIVEMPLPGLSPNDINISLSADNHIHIEANLCKNQSKTKNNDENKKHKCHIAWSHFFWERPIHVEIPIEHNVDPNLVKAKLDKGILRVEFSKIL